MKAVIQTRYGAPEDVLTLAEIDAPVPRDDEVLVRVLATSVNTPDSATVTGEPFVLRAATGLRRPRRAVRGTDVAGLVEAVGCAVTEFRPGDPVFGAGLDDARVGTFAERTAVPAERLALKPAGLSFEDAAACVTTGLTAADALRVAAVGPGTRLLINGAAGGVGTLAVQLARRLGAEVTGVCSTANLSFLRGLGADHVIDYTREDLTAVSTRYDVVLDNVLCHPPSRMIRLLAPSGVLIPNSLGINGGWFAGLPRMAQAGLLGLLGTDVRWARCRVTRQGLEQLATRLLDGLEVVTDRVLPLEQAPAAVARQLGRHARGKLVLVVDPAAGDDRPGSRTDGPRWVGQPLARPAPPADDGPRRSGRVAAPGLTACAARRGDETTTRVTRSGQPTHPAGPGLSPRRGRSGPADDSRSLR